MPRSDNDGRQYVVTDPSKPLDVAISSGSVSITEPVTVAGITNEVELKNNSGNPIPVSGAVTVSATRATTTATIANGGTTSGSVDLTNTCLLAFIAPAAWTTSALKIQGSADNSNWSDIIGSDGVAASVYSAITAAAAYSIDVAAMLPYRYIRFVAGSAQGAERVFTVITRPLA